jgi:hypothetical protein
MNDLIKYLLFPIFIQSSHWLSVRFYSNYCVPEDFIGYITSYITTSSPICSFTVQIMEKTSYIYKYICYTISIWTITAIITSYKTLFLES